MLLILLHPCRLHPWHWLGHGLRAFQLGHDHDLPGSAGHGHAPAHLLSEQAADVARNLIWRRHERVLHLAQRH